MKFFKRSIKDKLSVITYKNILTLLVITLLLIAVMIYITPISTALYFILGIIMPFIIGGAIAFIINIPMSFLENKILKKDFKGKRAVTMILSIIFVIALISLVFILFVPQLIQTIVSLKDRIPSFIEMIQQEMSKYAFLKPYAENLDNMIKNADYSATYNQIFEFLKNGNFNPISNVVSAMSGIISVVTNGVIAIVFAFYLLSSKEEVRLGSCKLLYTIFNEKIADRIYYFVHLLSVNFKSFIQGQVIDVIILGIIVFIAMLIFQIPYAAMISVLVAFLALIPVVGAFLGGSIGFLFILIDSPTKAIWFIIIFLVVQQIDNNFIYPKVVGDKVGLPAIFTLVAIVVGASLGGVVGMWVAIPFFSALYTVTKLYMTYNLNKKGIIIDKKPTFDFIDLQEKEAMINNLNEAEEKIDKNFEKQIDEVSGRK